MPYNSPNSTTYVGFWPVMSPGGGGAMQVRQYPLTSVSAVPIYAGDPLVMTSNNGVRPATTASGGGPGAPLLLAYVGVSAQYVSTTTVSATCLVYDDPNQVFAICASTSTVVTAPNILGKSVNFLATGPIGSTGGNSLTGRSNVALDAGSFNIGAILTSGVATLLSSALSPLKCIGVHPCELANPLTSTVTPWSTAAGASIKYLVQFNQHVFGNMPVPGNLVTT